MNYSASEPTAGFYRMRLVHGGPFVGIRIWHGQPVDPITNEIMDRSLCWNAQINGEWAEIDRVWPKCGRDPIAEAEYLKMVETAQWAKEHAPDDPQATPFRQTDWLESPVPKF